MLIGRITTSQDRTLRIIRVGRRKADGGSGTEWRCSCELETGLGTQLPQLLNEQRLTSQLARTEKPSVPCRHLKNLYQGDLDVDKVSLTKKGYDLLSRNSHNPGQKKFLELYAAKSNRSARRSARRNAWKNQLTVSG